MDESEQQADSAREGRVCLGGSLASAGDAAPFRNDTGDFYGRLLSAQLGERDNSKHLAACYFLPDSQDCLEKPFQAFGKGSGSGATGTFSTGPASELQPASTRASASLWAFAAGDRAEPPGSGPGRCSSDRPCADAEPVHRPRVGRGLEGDVFQRAIMGFVHQMCARQQMQADPLPGLQIFRQSGLQPAASQQRLPATPTPGASVAAAPHLALPAPAVASAAPQLALPAPAALPSTCAAGSTEAPQPQDSGEPGSSTERGTCSRCFAGSLGAICSWPCFLATGKARPGKGPEGPSSPGQGAGVF